MRRIATRRFALMATVILTASQAAGELPPGESVMDHEWNFAVYLDEKRIGYHNFQLEDRHGARLLTTEADFRVRFLFFTAYQYQHTNREVWREKCLQEIHSTTNANGTPFSVKGSGTDTGITIETRQSADTLQGCIKTFAYWDPTILQATRLLNSQTGELLPVNVEQVAEELIEVRGQPTQAARFRLTARNMELDVWYSRDWRWLALESTIKGGRKLRYELT